jgi:hypothetical protein
MPYTNQVTSFITQRGPEYGTSLYYVTNHWVIRCSGNTRGDRTAETFIRRREIRYIDTEGESRWHAEVGRYPREGEHDGNRIVRVLDRISRSQEPDEWSSVNGVAWTTAVDEIDAAIDYAQRTQYQRASRRVGARAFTRD